ncbi:MAG TPA: hypothetical protein VFK56_20740, partial [Mycobacterium sp.]|nr:hypothetical protein [Mycobacterium sp.]
MRERFVRQRAAAEWQPTRRTTADRWRFGFRRRFDDARRNRAGRGPTTRLRTNWRTRCRGDVWDAP